MAVAAHLDLNVHGMKGQILQHDQTAIVHGLHGRIRRRIVLGGRAAGAAGGIDDVAVAAVADVHVAHAIIEIGLPALAAEDQPGNQGAVAGTVQHLDIHGDLVGIIILFVFDFAVLRRDFRREFKIVIVAAVALADEHVQVNVRVVRKARDVAGIRHSQGARQQHRCQQNQTYKLLHSSVPPFSC